MPDHIVSQYKRSKPRHPQRQIQVLNVTRFIGSDENKIEWRLSGGDHFQQEISCAADSNFRLGAEAGSREILASYFGVSGVALTLPVSVLSQTA
jgi:hypothetical protein